MQIYKNGINHILKTNVMTPPTRTGTRTLIVHPMYVRYDLSTGKFPLLTTRKMNFHATAAELDGFLKGITDKKWYQDNGCNFWNEWANQTVVRQKMIEQGISPDDNAARKELQKSERDIFSGYGWEWVHSGAEYRGYNADYTGHGVNQLSEIISSLAKNKVDRQLIMTAWTPANKTTYALPPCIYDYHFYSHEGKTLNLTYNQRSADMCLGMPNDFASCALLLILVARAAKMKPSIVNANLEIPHIYEPHIEKIREQMTRRVKELPTLELKDGVDCFNFNYADVELKNYRHHKFISYERSV